MLARPDCFVLVLEAGLVKWGPIPFRFENMQVTHRKSGELIAQWWSECGVKCWSNFEMMCKLKQVT